MKAPAKRKAPPGEPAVKAGPKLRPGGKRVQPSETSAVRRARGYVRLPSLWLPGDVGRLLEALAARLGGKTAAVVAGLRDLAETEGVGASADAARLAAMNAPQGERRALEACRARLTEEAAMRPRGGFVQTGRCPCGRSVGPVGLDGRHRCLACG